MPAVLLAVLSGALLYLSSPGPWGYGLLAWTALLPLLLAVRKQPVRRAFFLGLVCGGVFYPVLLRWIVIVLSEYGYLPLWVSLPALLLLALYMSFYLGTFAAAAAILQRRPAAILTVPAVWVALDYVRAHLFTGFPWMDLAYTQFRFPLLIQTGDLAGHYGVTFLIVTANLLLTLPFMPAEKKVSALQEKPAIICAVAMLGAALLYGHFRLEQVERMAAAERQLPLAVIQGNIPQDQKWNPDLQARTVSTYLALSRQAVTEHPAALLVWPETALPFFPAEDDTFSRIAGQLLTPSQSLLLTGAPHRIIRDDNGSVSYYNSAFLVAPDGMTADRYDKHHLVPFGEYIPLRTLLPMLAPVVETMGDFDRGSRLRPVTCQNLSIGVLICFESIFPELARRQVENGARLLANITNDAWFGRSDAPWQHLAMAVFRAVETRRGLARAANTGISALIAPSGRMTGTSPLFTPCFLSGELAILPIMTMYVRYGHLFPWFCLGLGIVAVAAGYRHNRKSNPS